MPDAAGRDAATLAMRIGDFAVGVSYPRLPAEVVASVRMRLLDTLGICVAATALDTSAAARDWVLDQGGRPQAQAVGLPGRVPAALAGFLNGVLAHSLDYDDTHLPSVLHPSASVIPAALAAAQAAGADGQAVIAAIAAGLEVCVRVGMAGYDPQGRNSAFFEHGQHATSICGALGGAVSAGLLLGLDAAGVTHAIGVAASMASGLIEANRTGGTVKRCTAAGPRTPESPPRNWCGTVSPARPRCSRAGSASSRPGCAGSYDPAAITEGLGSDWSVPGIFFKPYPANHFTHAAIDAAIALRARGVRPADVESAILGVAAPTVRTIGEPIEAKRAPQTGYMAQFSGPYAVAAGLAGGSGLGVGLDDFTDELARDAERRALMARVSVVADDRCTDIFPHQFPAVLRVRTRDGRELTAEVMTNRGGPGNPLTYAELVRKFRDNVRGKLDETARDRVEHSVARLAELTDMAEILGPLGFAAGQDRSGDHPSTTN